MSIPLGTKLSRLRNNKGFTQQYVADELNISQPTYHTWESETAKPSLENLLKLSRLFEVDLSYLTEEGSSLIYNNTFEGSNIVGNNQHVINMHSPELIESILKNQDKMMELFSKQNKLFETLIENLQK